MKKRNVIVKFSIGKYEVIDILYIGEYNIFKEWETDIGILFATYEEMFKYIEDYVEIYYPREEYGNYKILFEKC